VDLEDLRRVVSVAHPDHGAAVYFPGIPLSYLVNEFLLPFLLFVLSYPSQNIIPSFFHFHKHKNMHTRNFIILCIKLAFTLPNSYNTRETHTHRHTLTSNTHI